MHRAADPRPTVGPCSRDDVSTPRFPEVVSLLVLAAAMLSGCSGDDEAPDAEAPPPKSPTASEEPRPVAPESSQEPRAAAPKPKKAPVVRDGDLIHAVTTAEDLFLHLDPATGFSKLVGKMGIGGVEDLTVGPDGRVVAVCWDGKPRLFRIDPATGKGTKGPAIEGTTLKYKVVEGMATVDGVLYGSASADDSYCGDCANHLVRIDPETGAATEVGAFGPEFLNVESLAYSPRHGLLGVDIGTLVPPDFQSFNTRPALVRIDTATGRATKIGDLPPRGVELVKNPYNTKLSPQGPFLCGLCFAPDDTLYATTFPTHFGGESNLVTVDPETAELKEIGPTLSGNIDGILYVPAASPPGDDRKAP